MQFSLSAITAFVALASSVVASPINQRSSGYYITIQNSCPHTVWPGVGQTTTSPSSISYADSGFELTSGASRTISVPSTWLAGRIFGRTGCTGEGNSLSCDVGDCGGLSCLDNTGVEGVTLAEFSYSDMVLTFYNLSLISGYNLGMKIIPTDGVCSTYDCPDEGCPNTQAYRDNVSTNPTMGCPLTSSYTVQFCPS